MTDQIQAAALPESKPSVIYERKESFPGGSLAAGNVKNNGQVPSEVPHKRRHFSPPGQGVSLPGKNSPFL